MFKNWQVKVAFWIAGLLGTSTVGWRNPDGSLNLWAIGFGLALAIGGMLAKQHNVTGGTVPLTKEAESRTTGTAALPSTKK